MSITRKKCCKIDSDCVINSKTYKISDIKEYAEDCGISLVQSDGKKKTRAMLCSNILKYKENDKNCKKQISPKSSQSRRKSSPSRGKSSPSRRKCTPPPTKIDTVSVLRQISKNLDLKSTGKNKQELIDMINENCNKSIIEPSPPSYVNPLVYQQVKQPDNSSCFGFDYDNLVNIKMTELKEALLKLGRKTDLPRSKKELYNYLCSIQNNNICDKNNGFTCKEQESCDYTNSVCVPDSSVVNRNMSTFVYTYADGQQRNIVGTKASIDKLRKNIEGKPASPFPLIFNKPSPPITIYPSPPPPPPAPLQQRITSPQNQPSISVQQFLDPRIISPQTTQPSISVQQFLDPRIISHQIDPTRVSPPLPPRAPTPPPRTPTPPPLPPRVSTPPPPRVTTPLPPRVSSPPIQPKMPISRPDDNSEIEEGGVDVAMLLEAIKNGESDVFENLSDIEKELLECLGLLSTV